SRPRPRRAEGLGHHLRQKAHAYAQRTSEIRRTLAAVPHGRLLVHVARLPTRRPRRLTQNPPPQHQRPPPVHSRSPHSEKPSAPFSYSEASRRQTLRSPA